jgi:hypothetical protein
MADKNETEAPVIEEPKMADKNETEAPVIEEPKMKTVTTDSKTRSIPADSVPVVIEYQGSFNSGARYESWVSPAIAKIYRMKLGKKGSAIVKVGE